MLSVSCRELRRLIWPVAAIDKRGRARKHDIAGAVPAQGKDATRLLHFHYVIDEAVDVSRDHDRTSARAAGLGLADTALPGPRLDVAAVDDLRHLKVDARGEEVVVLDLRSHVA